MICQKLGRDFDIFILGTDFAKQPYSHQAHPENWTHCMPFWQTKSRDASQ